MSGGHFNYVQYQFDDPVREIQARILLNKKSHAEAHEMIVKAEDEDLKLYEILYSVKDYVDYWLASPLHSRRPEIWDPEEKTFRLATRQEIESHNSEIVFNFDEDEVEIFKQAIQAIEKAQVYLQRIDWFLSGDDGDDSFKKRLAEELAALEK